MREFEKSKVFRGVMLLLVVGIIVLGAMQMFEWGLFAPVPEDIPLIEAQAIYNITWNTAAITEDTNSTAYLTQGYSYHDIFCTVDITAAQKIDIYTEASPDNSYWYTGTSVLTAVTADTEIFTRALSYGRYERVVFSVNTAAAVSPVCKSTYFSNWTPANYATEMD